MLRHLLAGEVHAIGCDLVSVLISVHVSDVFIFVGDCLEEDLDIIVLASDVFIFVDCLEDDLVTIGDFMLAPASGWAP